MQIYNKSNIHINNTSVSNGKFIKAQASNKINIDGTGEDHHNKTIQYECI